ncbi:alpha/beta hydrolase [Horticoccus luteus]|uniref:Alpha/beta hydrolase n=1 Tax=Horticoccus luteus TaxID=2862869 RepID=A0A8F9TW15_9BACT|nr:alpha/beta hydrolase [Horticoccus luteus]QYM78617.1 alpha/beta hydrolase [Horticoccus luteus]
MLIPSRTSFACALLSGLCAWLALPATLRAAAWPSEVVGDAQVYKQTEDGPQKLYVLEPDDWKPTDRRPAIVFFHGGGWVGGPLSQFNDQSRYFASRGLVCIQVQYRVVHPHTTTPPIVCIEDARSAMRWVRQHAGALGVDSHCIAAAGASAGGHLAAHTALVAGVDDPSDDLTISPRPDALLLFNPVLDNGPGEYGAERVRDRVAELSPAANVRRGAPPTVLFLGTTDPLVPVATLQRFRTAMLAAGARCELHLYAGQTHGFFNRSKSVKYYKLTLHECAAFLTSLGWLPVDAPNLPSTP